MLSEMFTENCCAELITISIVSVLVNQCIFELNFSTCDIFLVFFFTNTAYSIHINAKYPSIKKFPFDCSNMERF